jgi:hypothetical protein
MGADEAIAKDGYHFGAHRLLASALANTGDHAAAADHLVTVLAADYYAYAPALATDEDLKEFRTTQHGTAIAELADKLKTEYAKRIASALLVVGRYATFALGKPGTDFASSRGELYAYDRETKRYLRLTHTDHQVAGFIRSAAGSEVVLLGFDKVDRPKTEDEGPPVFARAWIEVIDAEWARVGQRINLAGPAREVAVGYGPGDQLLVATAPANGRWGIGPLTVSSIDRSTGKLTKVSAALPASRVVLSLEDGRVVRDAGGVTASWTGDPPTAPSLAVSGGPAISVPESGAAAQRTVAVAPGGARLAFATAVDPCSKDAAPSLYVADAKTGTLKHLLTSKSRFTTRWLDASTLAYEDGYGAIRLFDAVAGRESMKLENRWGLALEVRSPAASPLCKQAPPSVDDGGGSGDEPPLPPEEGSGSATGSGSSASGPVTQPQ